MHKKFFKLEKCIRQLSHYITKSSLEINLKSILLMDEIILEVEDIPDNLISDIWHLRSKWVTIAKMEKNEPSEKLKES